MKLIFSKRTKYLLRPKTCERLSYIIAAIRCKYSGGKKLLSEGKIIFNFFQAVSKITGLSGKLSSLKG
jgi:hypothetical protein